MIGENLCASLSQLKLTNCNLQFVSQFKYLGHIIDHTFCYNREPKCLFARANVLVRRFSYCSVQVKLKLFNTYCLCFYDIALWENFNVSVIGKLASAYIKCLKLFFFWFL